MIKLNDYHPEPGSVIPFSQNDNRQRLLTTFLYFCVNTMRRFAIQTDDDLLAGLQQGNEAAFTEIYERYWEKLLAIGYHHTHSKQAAEDVVHEVMMSLWERKTDARINSLEAYLATAVKFSVFKAIAREKRRREILSGVPLSLYTDDIESKLDARLLETTLHHTIDKLPDKARLVFTLSREHQLTIAEIAGKMDLSPKAVEYHMTKAFRALRNALQKIKIFFL